MSTHELRHAALLKQIRVELVERGMQQKDLADRMGLAKASLNRYLQNKTQMSLSVFYRISAGLDISPGELLARAESRLGDQSSMMS